MESIANASTLGYNSASHLVGLLVVRHGKGQVQHVHGELAVITLDWTPVTPADMLPQQSTNGVDALPAQ